MSELPVEDVPGLAGPAREAAEVGQVVYLTEHGQRLAAIVPIKDLRRLQDADDERNVRARLASTAPGRTFATAEEMRAAAGLA